MNKNKSIYVAVTGINDCDNPAPGVGVAKSLKEASDIEIHTIGLAYDAMEVGVYLSEVFDDVHMLPPLVSNFDDTLQCLLGIKQRVGLDMIIPTLDSEVSIYMKYEEELKKHGITLSLPTQKQFNLRDKEKLPSLCKSLGYPAPKQQSIFQLNELLTSIEEIGLPVVVKGAVYEAVYCTSISEAVVAFDYIIHRWGAPILIQEAIKGDEINLIGLGDGQGNVLGMVAIKKMLTTSLGKIWTGVTIQHEGLMHLAESFVKQTKWKGPFELECITKDDDIHIIEINPRFPAWVYFATSVGHNLPAQMVRMIQGVPIQKVSSYEAGTMYVRYTEEKIEPIHRFEQMLINGSTS